MHRGTNPELDGADWIMVWGGDEMHMYADLCWKLDNGFTDAYDPDTSYLLWAAQPALTTDDDLQDSRHKAVDGFEGAKLTATITFTDAQEETRSMTAAHRKLGVEYKDDTSGPSLTGEVLTDEQAAGRLYLWRLCGYWRNQHTAIRPKSSKLGIVYENFSEFKLGNFFMEKWEYTLLCNTVLSHKIEEV